jgi:hypothetical protein
MILCVSAGGAGSSSGDSSKSVEDNFFMIVDAEIKEINDQVS